MLACLFVCICIYDFNLSTSILKLNEKTQFKILHKYLAPDFIIPHYIVVWCWISKSASKDFVYLKGIFQKIFRCNFKNHLQIFDTQSYNHPHIFVILYKKNPSQIFHTNFKNPQKYLTSIFNFFPSQIFYTNFKNPPEIFVIDFQFFPFSSKKSENKKTRRKMKYIVWNSFHKLFALRIMKLVFSKDFKVGGIYPCNWWY